MTNLLKTPDHIAQAMRLPSAEQEEQLLTELALELYARGILSFGKARELTDLTKIEFGLLLGQRGIPRHYDATDLQDDMAYGHHQ